MSDESTKEYKLVTDKREEMQPIFDRMDEDEKLYLLDPYKLKKLPPFDAKEEDDVANVTLPGPLRYATKVMQIVGSAKRQTVVEGEKLTDKQTTKIEEFTDDIFYMVNEWLNKRGITSLDSKINEQIAIRGRIVGSSNVRFDKEGNLIPAVLPRESRHFVYENDENGMVWGAPIMTRSKAQIEREYGEEHSKGLGNKSVEVIDFWNTEKNVVFIDKKIAKDLPNTLKYPPFVVSISPGGSMLDTDDAFKHQGESI